MKSRVLILAVVGLIVGFPTVGRAQIILGTEDPLNGFVGTLPVTQFSITVGSDGEGSFDPFGAGYDTSDGISGILGWQPDPGYAAAFAPGFWTQLLDASGGPTGSWVLPAVTPAGVENEPGFEPVAGWFLPGAVWGGNVPASFIILEADGTWSDTITISNNGPGGSAQITFASDPVPEPSSLALLSLGAMVLLASRRLRKRSA